MGQTLPYALNQLTADELTTFSSTVGVYVNVKSYGAVGDGETDDTEAIQDAIDACSTAGIALYLSEGTYLISDTLLIRSNLYFFGSGSLSKLFLKAATQKNVIGCSIDAAIDNVVLRSFAIDGNAANQTATGNKTLQNGICLYQDNSDNLKQYDIINVEVYNCKSAGIYLGRQYFTDKNKKIINCNIKNNTANGIYIDDNCEYVEILDNVIQSNGVSGIRIVGSNININGGVVKGATTAYSVYATVGSNLCKTIISGVTMNHGKGIILDGVTLVNITGCQVLASIYDGIKLNASSFCSIVGNIIAASSQDTTDTYSEIALVASDNNIISNNILSAYSAIKAKYSIDCDADSENNKFTYNMILGAATADHNINTEENTYI
jgi:hypothetical protein